MSVSDELVNKFYAPIDEQIDKFVSQQISKEEFLSAFEKHCEATKDTISHDNFGQILRRGWQCGDNKKYSYDEYKKLISAFDEIVYIPNTTMQNDMTTGSRIMPENEYSASMIFEEHAKRTNRTSEVATKALYSIAFNPQREQALIDFYNENQRKLKESAIERYGWYDGHFNYEYGFAKEMEYLERDVVDKEKRSVKKDKLAQKITNKLQELRGKNKTYIIEDTPHGKTQNLQKTTKKISIARKNIIND